MYDNGTGPVVQTGYLSLAGLGTVAGTIHSVLLTVTIVFTSFVMWRLVMRGVRTSRR